MTDNGFKLSILVCCIVFLAMFYFQAKPNRYQPYPVSGYLMGIIDTSTAKIYGYDHYSLRKWVIIDVLNNVATPAEIEANR